MKELVISRNDEGGRLDRYLKKYLTAAPGSFIYRMLRKKNIVLNDQKADGSERLRAGDRIRLFFSDETLDRFTGPAEPVENLPPLPVIYEDDQIIALNKPPGILSQKAARGDRSVNEYLISYLVSEGQLNPEEPGIYTPSVCNRLDRNTSGIILAGKTLTAERFLSAALKEGRTHKEYLALAAGTGIREETVRAGLIRSEEDRMSHIVSDGTKGALPVRTSWRTLAEGRNCSLLRVVLHTGRTHQIRAQLAAAGHPVLGDPRYGGRGAEKSAGLDGTVKRQMLHAWRMTIEGLPCTGGSLNLEAPLFPDMKACLKQAGISADGIGE